MIGQQRQQALQYQHRLDQQQLASQQYARALQQQNRDAHYQYQQHYYDRLRQQRTFLNQRFDYNNDPYFYTAPSYRYSRGGRYYQVNRYGADLLRQAVNLGYEEGLAAGRADREDEWGFNFRDSFAYRDANYGYRGYYVNQRDYNYYFRQGFSRGYEDGYYSRYRYGRRVNGRYSMLGSVLSLVLNLQDIR